VEQRVLRIATEGRFWASVVTEVLLTVRGVAAAVVAGAAFWGVLEFVATNSTPSVVA
jgi:hypothetical protein